MHQADLLYTESLLCLNHQRRLRFVGILQHQHRRHRQCSQFRYIRRCACCLHEYQRNRRHQDHLQQHLSLSRCRMVRLRRHRRSNSLCRGNSWKHRSFQRRRKHLQQLMQFLRHHLQIQLLKFHLRLQLG